MIACLPWQQHAIVNYVRPKGTSNTNKKQKIIREVYSNEPWRDNKTGARRVCTQLAGLLVNISLKWSACQAVITASFD